MPSWKKVIVSGSDALLNSVYSRTFVSASSADITTSFTASGLNYPTQDNGEFSFIQTDGNGNLSLQYVNTIYETVYNAELTTIAKGTPLYVSGSQGAESKVYRADASNPLKMPVTYVAADNIDPATSGRGIVLGLITGVNTTGYAPGTEIYVGVGGGWTSTRPTGSNIAQLLGIVTKEGVGGQGLVLNPGPYNVPNLLSGQIFWGDTTGTPIKKSLAHILSGSNYIYSGSFSGSFQGDGSQLTGIQQIIPPTTRSVTGSFTSVTSSIITHNLDTENVLVSVYDNTKTYILPNSIQILDEDNVRITFTSPTTGYAVITNGGHVISGSVDWSNLYNVPNGLVSSSAQISYNSISNIPSGIVSSSAQISFTGITNKPTLVSGSSQINYSGISGKPGGIVSSSAQISALGYTTCTGTVTSIIAGSFLTGGTITTSGTIAVDATSSNVASKVVSRDASGNFSAGTITGTIFSGNGRSLTNVTASAAYNVSGSGNTRLSFWAGTQAQYDAIGSKSTTTIYFIKT